MKTNWNWNLIEKTSKLQDQTSQSFTAIEIKQIWQKFEVMLKPRLLIL